MKKKRVTKKRWETSNVRNRHSGAGTSEAQYIAIQEAGQRIIQHLHEELADKLGFLTYTARTLESCLDDCRPSEEALALLIQIQEVSTQITHELHDRQVGLKFLVLPPVGSLSTYLNNSIEEIARHYNLNIELVAGPVEETEVISGGWVHLLRIIQEALANIRMHARTNKAVVELIKDDHYFLLKVSDEGIGFDPAGLSQSPGLCRGFQMMREWARLANYQVDVSSRSGAGTTVLIRIPV